MLYFDIRNFDMNFKIDIMKKFYIMAVLGLSFLQGTAQQFFSENFGTLTPSDPNQNVSDYNGFQYGPPISYSGTAMVSGDVSAIGYPAASGFSNVTFEPSTTQYLLVSGINTSGYSSDSITMTFGYYKDSTSAEDILLEYSTNGTNFTPVEFSLLNDSGWQLVRVNNTIPAAENLSIRFSQRSNLLLKIDDLRFRTSEECPLRISTIYSTCNENTLGTDTYTVFIPFNGGGSQSYGITASSGTVMGDNPTTQEEGIIQIADVQEGRDLTFDIVGTSCDYSYFVNGPQCKPEQELPLYDSFNYTAGTNLTTVSPYWASTSGGAILEIQNEGLSHPSMPSQFNSLKLGRGGRDAYTKFTPVTNNRIFSSFIFSLEDLAVLTAEGDNTIVAAFSESLSFSRNTLRMYVQKAGSNYRIGISSGNDAPVYSTETFDLNENLFVVVGYDYTTNNVMAWVNPTVSTIEDETPSISAVPTITPADFGSFSVYQNGVVAYIDEIKIGTSLSVVTTSALSNDAFSNNGFAVYPNPLTGNDVLNIQTPQNGTKSVLIYDMTGKQVFTTSTSAGSIAPQLSSGLYMVKITENNISTVKKLIVN